MQTGVGFDRYREFYVYAVLWRGEHEEAVKIGYSGDIGRRLNAHYRQLGQAAKMFAILGAGRNLDDATLLEGALHEAFQARRIRREWYRFKFSDEKDKRAFNDGCRAVLRKLYGANTDRWWTKIPRAALEAGRSEQQAMFLPREGRELNHQEKNKRRTG